MLRQSLYQTFQRYRSLSTGTIRSLPIVILMPHSGCNCRCVMCDIWKDNKRLRQLTENDIRDLLDSLIKWNTRQVLMSGGEALLNPHFFRFCEILRSHEIRVTLLSTGITLKKNAAQLARWVNDIIVSLDGPPGLHDQIRNIPGAFDHLKAGIEAIRSIDAHFRVTGRSVIHRINFRQWPDIIGTAKAIGLNQVSFLPADVSSHAFNREVLWSDKKQHEILPGEKELDELQSVIGRICRHYAPEIASGFIAENPAKLLNIHLYYSAFYGHNPFPYKKCNAPWVSTVIEADGTVRPCFFHAPLGNIRDQRLPSILNGDAGIRFRRNLDMDKDETCQKCVCYLHLSPGTTLK